VALNVFRAYEPEIYKHKFAGRIEVVQLMGGTPFNQKVAEGWLKTKLGLDKESAIQQAVAEVMASTPETTKDEALKAVDIERHLNGFKRNNDEGGILMVEGRHLKAMLKEAASVARSVGNLPAKMGLTNKGTLSFIAEHVIVVDDRLHIGKADPLTGKVLDVTEPDGILQSFPKNPITRQTGIQYTEFVENAVIEFTVVSDYDFSEKEWAAMWITGGNQGIGAGRSQGYGKFNITKWEKLKA
jgi:hypothetical protein